MSVTGIVLAGGRSSRFGADKLAAELNGETILAMTIGAVASVTDGVIVAGSSLPEGFRAGDIPVALVRDVEPFAGPLVALANVLATANTDSDEVAIVVGGDMPRVAPAVLLAMLGRLDADRAVEAVTLALPPPLGASRRPGASRPARRQTLPLALRVGPARGAAREALEAGDRSLNRLLDRLRSVEMPGAEWLPLDPAADTLVDVDTIEDLERARAFESR